MTQLKARNVSFPSHRQDCSNPPPRTALGQTEAQKSDPPKAPKKPRPERLGLGLLTSQMVQPLHIKPPNAELLPLALRRLLVGGGVDTELPRETQVVALDC